MKSALLIAAIAAVAVGAAPAVAQKPANTVSLSAAPTLITFGGSTVLSGTVAGPDSTGVRVDLLVNPHPFAGFKPSGAAATTDAAGKFSFTVKPALFTRYQVTAKAKPQVDSAVVEVRVRPRISLSVDDTRARRGQRVLFSGGVSPAHEGQAVVIQRRIGTGSFRTISTVTLVKSASPGRSTYSTRLRVTRTATYRVRKAADADHAAGTSRTRRVRVG